MAFKKTSQTSSHSEDTEAVASTDAVAAESAPDIDSILDEIDEVLEENAEEFVKSYVQKGGE